MGHAQRGGEEVRRTLIPLHLTELPWPFRLGVRARDVLARRECPIWGNERAHAAF